MLLLIRCQQIEGTTVCCIYGDAQYWTFPQIMGQNVIPKFLIGVSAMKGFSRQQLNEQKYIHP